jgi:hypothetical protein
MVHGKKEREAVNIHSGRGVRHGGGSGSDVVSDARQELHQDLGLMVGDVEGGAEGFGRDQPCRLK